MPTRYWTLCFQTQEVHCFSKQREAPCCVAFYLFSLCFILLKIFRFNILLDSNKLLSLSTYSGVHKLLHVRANIDQLRLTVYIMLRFQISVLMKKTLTKWFWRINDGGYLVVKEFNADVCFLCHKPITRKYTKYMTFLLTCKELDAESCLFIDVSESIGHCLLGCQVESSSLHVLLT